MKTGQPRGAVDVREPEHVARALWMPLRYVVMTMVDRDDLLDGGAAHMAKTVRRLKELRSDMIVETLVGDFGGHREAPSTRRSIMARTFGLTTSKWCRAFSDRCETVRCNFDQSLAVLRWAKERSPQTITKNSIMLGVGETDSEVLETMRDLRSAEVDVNGPVLQPTPTPRRGSRYVEPERFDGFARDGRRWASRS